MKTFWDERYREEGFAYGTEPNDFLVSQQHRIPEAGRVLCIAEGEGRNALFLATRGFHVTGVDQSMVGLEKAQELGRQYDVEIQTRQADLADFEIESASWDGVVSISAHLPSAIRARLHKQVVAGLKPGGVLILEAYTPKHIDMPGVGGPPPDQIDMFMSLEALKHELKGLEFLHALETERHMNEGKYHQGPSAVVQVVARKP